MTVAKKYYSMHEIQKQGLLLKPDGLPFTDLASIRRRIKSFGHVPCRTNGQGTLIYAITADDLKKMNSYGTRNINE
jgi:hypothetical protein